MRALKAANLALAFALELAVLAALVVGGLAVAGGAAGIALGVLAATAWAVLWGLVASPRAPVGLTGLARIGFELVWFGAGTTALVLADHRVAGAVLATMWALNAVLARAWHQTTEQTRARRDGVRSKPGDAGRAGSPAARRGRRPGRRR